MVGETDLPKILRTLQPVHNPGEYAFCRVESLGKVLDTVKPEQVLFSFNEEEGTTIVLEKRLADRFQLEYSYVASWITLTANSSLMAVGLTAAFSAALANNGVSCNVVAANFHDHLFVNPQEVDKAMRILNDLTKEL